MGKNKLARWTELDSFDNVIQPDIGDVSVKDHPIKGSWNIKMFRNDNPVILELGCGKGEYTTGLATRFPQNNYIGIDIKGARMWRGAKTSNEQKLPNVAFLRTRIEFINSFFSADEVDEIWITFPDPHPGGRNTNKRLTSPWYLNIYRRFLKNKGVVHLKTDNVELFNFTKSVVSDNNLEILIATSDLYSEYLSDDILSIRTHYEKLFLNDGLKINYLSFRLDNEKTIEYVSRKAKNE
ncbi:MAG: tRNA (guanosine(46)-N7)-methyltransferase TrmB [Bacteroidetes bacterium]|nr:MAG: tRNA (guanosine(46)-N7)-methyltransferase TrmB [Bacteroidota bacterium]